MNLPNKLTVARLILTVIFIYALTRETLFSTMTAVVLFAVASITDYLDGYYAKKYNLVSNFGKIMDPIADKVLILAAFYIFMRMHIIFAWMFYVILVREVLVTLSRIVVIKKGQFIAAEKAGKLKTVSQIVSVSIILIFLVFYEAGVTNAWSAFTRTVWIKGINGLMIITVALTLISGLSYFWNNRQLFGKYHG